MADVHTKLVFTSQGKRIELARGDVHRVSREYDYRDAPVSTVSEIIKGIKDGKNWRELVRAAFENNNPWLYKIITAKQRTLFIEQYPLKKNSLILDIGSGWGQFTLSLAKNNTVCALEPTSERLEFIKVASNQENKDKNIFFIGEDFLKINFETKYDYALCIGVLEWVGLFSDIDPIETQKAFLNKIKQELKPDGELIIGIENRLGLKYLLGANDDHTGIPNVLIHEAILAKKKYKTITGRDLKVFTYTKLEIEHLLKSVGFTKIKIYAAMPDYKIPEIIIPLGKALNKYGKNIYIPEHDGYNGKLLENQEKLKQMYKCLSDINIISNYAPSFYIKAKIN
jgi:SAM-dependent methyltransferase